VKWLLMIYRIPREPTSARVYVWRKLTQLGAVALQDAVWIVPATDRIREQYQWIASEITEMAGEVSVFEADATIDSMEAPLVDRFEAPVKQAYQEILVALKRRKPDLAALSKRYLQTKQKDFFQCSLEKKVRTNLLAAQGERT
jgi:DNA-binding transcriptional regulator PaaX